MNNIKNKIYMYFFVGCDPCGRPAPMMFKAVFVCRVAFAYVGNHKGMPLQFFATELLQ